MNPSVSESAPPDQWTLIRGARQLLTLRGASGSRRGAAMSDLGLIPDGAILIRNGLIEKIGTARQVENMTPARQAREIDASGKVILPAYVDPDVAIAAPGPDTGEQPGYNETDIRRMSYRRLEGNARALASDLARYGVLTVGGHTHFATDLQNTLKALRLHQAMQSQPLRIRSVFSPPWLAGDGHTIHFERVSRFWMPSVFSKRLASVLEVSLAAPGREDARLLAGAAAACGFNIRFRVAGIPGARLLDLAYSAGAIAVLGAIPDNTAATRALADAGCVHIVTGAQLLAGKFRPARDAVNDGMPIALASGYRGDCAASLNPQFLIFLACQTLGLTAEEAIVAVTYNAACSLRLSHVTGSLDLGKSADLCILDVDHYSEMARRAGQSDVSLVMQAGKVTYRRAGLTAEQDH